MPCLPFFFPVSFHHHAFYLISVCAAGGLGKMVGRQVGEGAGDLGERHVQEEWPSRGSPLRAK